jgi:NAD(P) transhydrogenase subunit alpha
MKIAIAKETAANEARCAISVDAVKKYVALGASVTIEAGAGEASGISDAACEAAGASMADSAADACDGADILLCVNTPPPELLAQLNDGAHVVGMLAPFDTKDWSAYHEKTLHAYAMELLPRISRAQSMDVLSSQSNLAGYRAVIEAVQQSAKAIPMMMTAAGTIPPAKVLVIGAGVAGLQAIATAKRLGAVVSAFDVRPAVKEQVESLGGKFIEVAPSEGAEAETKGGYAKEMDEDYKKRQAEAMHEALKTQDIVISTALIPGKGAPELITKSMLADMKPGSVIVDLAAIAGGNCRATKADKVTEIGGVTLIGYTNLPSRAARDATPLYARNLYNFVSTLFHDANDASWGIKWDDELIQGTLITKDGAVVHPQLTTD